mgnify:CR=1 FL=1
MPGITLTEEEVRKLTSCGNPDAAVLFLYRKAELPRETALAALHFTVPRMVGATDTLRQLGLWQEERPVHPTPEHPQYTEEDLKREQQAGDGRFRNLVGEAQRRLGRTLSTEELKILLSLIDYLRLPTEVVGVLLYYCLERSRRRDSRAPSMRAIEKEAYRWADEGIDTLEETIQLLTAGRIDATLNADVSFYDYLNVHPDANFKLVAQTEEASHVAIPVLKSDDTAFLDALNSAIEALRADGTLKELSEKYFGEDISSEN